MVRSFIMHKPLIRSEASVLIQIVPCSADFFPALESGSAPALKIIELSVDHRKTRAHDFVCIQIISPVQMGDPLAGGHRAVLFSVFPASVLLFHPAGRKFLFRLLFVVLTWNRNSRRLVFRSTALLLRCRFLIRILLGTFRLILLPGYGRAVIFCCAYPCRR